MAGSSDVARPVLEVNGAGRHRIRLGDEVGPFVRYESISALGDLRGFSSFWTGVAEEGIYRLERASETVRFLDDEEGETCRR